MWLQWRSLEDGREWIAAYPVSSVPKLHEDLQSGPEGSESGASIAGQT
jgi:hypothetical protein